MREISIINGGSVPEGPPLAAAVERACRLQMPLGERTQQPFMKSWVGLSLPILLKMAGFVRSQGVESDVAPSCARLLNDSNTRHVR